MSENQNDKRNQVTDSKSQQEFPQIGKKKEETNPNNPTAETSKHQVKSEEKNPLATTKGETNVNVHDTLATKKDTLNLVKTDTSKKGENENLTGNQPNRKGSL